MLNELVSKYNTKLIDSFAEKTRIFFQQKILAYLLYLMIKSFNDTLTNDIVSFEQMGPGLHIFWQMDLDLASRIGYAYPAVCAYI